MVAIEEVGGSLSFNDQQAAIIKQWGADSLIEDSFKKSASYEDIVTEADQATKSSIGSLFDAREIEQKTELNTDEVLVISRLLFASQRYDLSGVDEFIVNLLKLKVSHQRRGRREFIEGLHAEERRGMARDAGPLASFLGRVGL